MQHIDRLDKAALMTVKIQWQ